MTQQPAAHIEPSEHSTDEVDAFLDMVEDNVDSLPGAGSPAIKPNKELGEDGKPVTETQDNASI
jgi:cell division septum initiation protein DivIVA